jgi:hypothetical protein
LAFGVDEALMQSNAFDRPLPHGVHFCAAVSTISSHEPGFVENFGGWRNGL